MEPLIVFCNRLFEHSRHDLVPKERQQNNNGNRYTEKPKQNSSTHFSLLVRVNVSR